MTLRYSLTLSAAEEIAVRPIFSPAARIPRGPAAGAALRIVAVALATWAGGAAAEGDPAPETLGGLIADLGADQFARREAATRQLAAAGAAAVGPLAEAARGGDLEVASRAVEILRGFLDPEAAGEGGSADAAAAAALAVEAERVLESLAEGPGGPAAQLATTSLEFHQLGMHEAARDQLESLGAKFTDGLVVGGRRGLSIVVDGGWAGGVEDLRLLPRLRNLRHVSIHGLRIDPATLSLLGRLRNLETLQLFGTGIDDEAIAALAARLPNAEIDVRKGGKMGVGGQRLIGPCQITQVVAGSAADRAGIQIGDVVLTLDGEEVKNFDALTDFIGRLGPGDSVEVEVERAVAGQVPRRFTCTVTLDGWD